MEDLSMNETFASRWHYLVINDLTTEEDKKSSFKLENQVAHTMSMWKGKGKV